MLSSFIVIYNCLNEDLTSYWEFGTYQQMRLLIDHAHAVG